MAVPSVDLSVLRGTSAGHIPQPKARWKTRVLLPAVILGAFGAMLSYTMRDALWPARQVQVARVVPKDVSGTNARISFQAAGWVEADPFTTYVSALTDGVIKEFLVLEGQRVNAGDVVARMVDDDARLALARANATVKQFEAELLQAESDLKAAQLTWENPVERARAVAATDSMLAESRAELLRLKAEADVEIARKEELAEQLKREEDAAKVSAIPEWQTIQTRLRLKAQSAMLESINAKQPVLEAKVRQQEAELTAARENLRLRIEESRELEKAKAGIPRIKAMLEEAVVDRDTAALRLERMSVRSPADGVVMQRMSEPGAKLMLADNDMHSAHAARLYDPKRLQVRVDVPLANAAQVQIGQSAEIVVEVLRDIKFKGKITRIVHEADIQKNTLQVKVAIEDPRPELKPEMLARVQFIATQSKQDASAKTQRLFVPENAIQRASGNQAHAWIVDKGRGIATHRMLTLGDSRIDGWIEATSGVQPGDDLITGDTSSISEGLKVKVAETMAEGGSKHGSH